MSSRSRRRAAARTNGASPAPAAAPPLPPGLRRIAVTIAGGPGDVPPDGVLTFEVDAAAGDINVLLFDEGAAAWRALRLPAGTWKLEAGEARPKLWTP